VTREPTIPSDTESEMVPFSTSKYAMALWVPAVITTTLVPVLTPEGTEKDALTVPEAVVPEETIMPAKLIVKAVAVPEKPLPVRVTRVPILPVVGETEMVWALAGVANAGANGRKANMRTRAMKTREDLFTFLSYLRI
jgi:hypothetical protein